jgi:hypothetical protein
MVEFHAQTLKNGLELDSPRRLTMQDAQRPRVIIDVSENADDEDEDEDEDEYEENNDKIEAKVELEV